MIDVLLPTKGRDHLLPKVLERIKETTDNPHTVTVIREGDSPAKAINIGFKRTTEPYFIFFNDDFNPQPGWDTKALAKMSDTVSVVAIHDGNPGKVQWGTITLNKRSYIDEIGGTENPGEVYHEGYTHEYVDTELWERARKRGVAAIAADSKIIHEHPAFGYPADATHQKPGRDSAKDSQLFIERRRQWLG